jgi:anthranilate phosphoribosyltransferase
MNFLPYLKAVGTGKKRNRDLSQDELKIVMKAMLDGEVIPEQISAFLLGWRMKGETIEEFKGAINAFDEFITPCPIANSIEFGYPYDGKVNNPYIFPLMAKYLEPYGVQLSLHGDVLQPAKGGTPLKYICDNMKLDNNIHYFDRKEYFKELHNLSVVRERFGMRSPFNTIEKLLNITQSDTAIIGAFHKPFVEKYIALFQDRYKKLIIIKGNEGTPEIFSKCAITVVENQERREYKFDPKDYGVDYKKSWDEISEKESLAMTEHPSEELERLAEFNAKVLLFLLGKVEKIEIS